jgi:hypothetical protein
LSILEFSTNLIKLIASSLTDKKFKILVEGDLFMPKKKGEGFPASSILDAVLYSLYINDVLAAPGTHLALWTDDTNIRVYETEKHESIALRKLQRELIATNSWCERRNIKINGGETQAIYFSTRPRVPDEVLQLNGREIPFLNNVIILVSPYAGGWHGRTVA